MALWSVVTAALKTGRSGCSVTLCWSGRHSRVDNVRASVTETAWSQELPDFRGFGWMANLRQTMSSDPAFETDVRNLLAAPPQQLMDGLDWVLYRWAGTEDVVPASRGSNIDARKLTALERFTGTPFPERSNGRKPERCRGGFLENASTQIRNHYAARFLVFGSWFNQIFPNAAYSPTTDFLVLNQDVRNIGVMLRNMRADGDPNADTAISLMPMIVSNSESAHNDLFLFNGSGSSNTTSTVTGVAFADTGAATIR